MTPSSTILAGALGMAATDAGRRVPGGGTAHEGLVELYHYPDGWKVARIVDPLKLTAVKRTNFSTAKQWLSKQAFLILIDSNGGKRNVIGLPIHPKGELHREVRDHYASSNAYSAATPKYRYRWIVFFIDMVFGDIPETSRLGTISMPIVLPSQIRQKMPTSDEEGAMQRLRQALDHAKSQMASTGTLRLLRSDIMDVASPIVKRVFTPRYKVETGNNGNFRVFLRWDDIYNYIDILTTSAEGTWRILASNQRYSRFFDCSSNALVEAWNKFITHLELGRNIPVVYDDAYDDWFDKLPWGRPAAGVDMEIYFLLGGPTPVSSPLDDFLAWAKEEGLL